VVVSTPVDGGHNWSSPVKVAAGTGSFGSVVIFNDKEYISERKAFSTLMSECSKSA